jgi:hypothetical protein
MSYFGIHLQTGENKRKTPKQQITRSRYEKGKNVKQCRYRPGVAQRVPGI